MIEIKLQKADNGIIKNVKDDNTNVNLHKQLVYDFNDDEDFTKRMSFINDILDDLAVDRGNIFTRKNLCFTVDWGKNYTPNTDEIDNKIKTHEAEIEKLKALKNNRQKEQKAK